MKHRRREPGSGVSYSRSNISRGMQGPILKMPNFSALRIQLDNNQLDSQSELIIPAPSAATSAFQHVLPSAIRTPQNKRSSDRNRRSQSYYGPENSLPDFAITASPESPVRAGHVENYQPTNIFVVETVQSASEQLPAKDIIYPVTGNDSPLDTRVRPFCRSEDPDTRAGRHIYDCNRSLKSGELWLKNSGQLWLNSILITIFLFHIYIVSYDNNYIFFCCYLFNREPSFNFVNFVYITIHKRWLIRTIFSTSVVCDTCVQHLLLKFLSAVKFITML